MKIRRVVAALPARAAGIVLLRSCQMVAMHLAYPRPPLPPPAAAPEPPGTPIPRRGRIPSLDGWRGIAILLVLVSHSSDASGYRGELWPWVPFVVDGNFGVRIFFVISGLLITFLLLREAHGTGGVSLRAFYARRALRILPVYSAYLAVVALLTALHCYHDTLSSWLGALTFTRNFMGLGNSATIHLWSLSIEEQFYFVWPCCFAGLTLWKKPRAYVGGLLLVVAACPFFRAHAAVELGGSLRNHLLNPLATWMYADSLAIGCLGALAAWHWRGTRRHPAALAGAALAAGLAIVGGQWLQWHPERVSALARGCIPAVQAFSILCLIWISVCRESGWFFRCLNARWLTWLGALSYSLYVWHLLFLGDFVNQPMASWPTHDHRCWYVGAFVVACLSYYGLEQPVRRIKARLRPVPAGWPPSASGERA